MTPKRASPPNRYLIGIDLGTTQTALSYLDLEDPGKGIRSFAIPQLAAARQIEEQPTLPSVVFLNDAPSANPPLPWDPEPDYLMGRHALEKGLEIPARLIHSAKSWLCHPRVDRQAAILPWQCEGLARKLSPVQVSTAILDHLRRAWDFQMAREDPTAAFLRQKIIVTIPASFDPVARNLTLQAIEAAGITQVTLLEEPQAAFYDFLARHPEHLAAELAGVQKVLVIDIGGGTTDFSLIEVAWPVDEPEPSFSRLAVGPHLLIGGDNLDLAVARLVEADLRHKGKKLAAKQWLAVLNQSRAAKETALSDREPGTVRFVLSGVGSRVISQTVTEEVDRERIRQLILEGFFPTVPADALPEEEAGVGISEAGLPYARDAGVSRHLAAFLGAYGEMPEAVLFNGGTTISPLLRDRLVEILGAWQGGRAPRLLNNPHPTQAVAAGAVYYGMVTLGKGHRVRSGNPVSLYLGIGTAKKSTAARHVPEQVLCVLPKGASAERPYSVADKKFGVDLGRDVAFYLYFSPAPMKSESFGGLYKYNSRRHSPLPPMRMAAEAGRGIRQVRLEAMLRETGYLQIRCLDVEDGSTRQLAFDLAQDPAPAQEKPPARKKAVLNKRQQGAIDKALETAVETGNFHPLYKELGEAVGSPRESWDVDQLRGVFDLVAAQERFADSPEAFVWWIRLLGYCLRPGFGAAGDPARVDRLWDLGQGKLPEGHPVFWSEWWLLLKRIAPGLDPARQLALQRQVEPLLFPPKRHDKGMRTVEQHERDHLWRLLGHCERLPVEEKERLGWWALKAPLSFARDSIALYAVGRLGARVLSYAPPEFLIHQAVANQWTELLLTRTNAGGGSYLEWALRELGRKTSDRLARIDEVLRKKLIDLFKKAGKKKAFLEPLLEEQDLQAEDLAQFCGERLPSGFVWVKDLASEAPPADEESGAE